MEGFGSTNSHPRGIDTKEDIAEAEEGHILEVHALPLLGVQPDIIVTVEDTPPDAIFQPPPRPKPAETPRVPFGSLWIHPQRFPTSDGLAPLFSPLSTGAALVLAGALVATRLVVRARQSRCEFACDLERLEASSEESSRDPALDETTSQGTLTQREQESVRRVSTLKELITKVAKANKRCSWEPRGESRSRLIACSNKLSKALAGVEQAGEELRIMSEIERLVGEIDDAGRGSGRDGDGRLSSDDDTVVGAYETIDDENGPGEGGNCESGRVQRGARSQKRPSSSARLSTRANALLSTRSENDENDASRCVFMKELKQWCDALATREQETKDRLKLALGRWDLKMVDTALLQLRLLEFPEMVKEFQKRREDIRSKQWMLRQELKDAQADPKRGDFTTRLRQACVKAEIFSGTAFPEYESAKESLNKAYLAVLEVQAKRIKTLHGLPPDASDNVRLDFSGSPSLLLEDMPKEFDLTDDHANKLALESDDRAPGVDRQLVLSTTGGITSMVPGTGAGALQHHQQQKQQQRIQHWLAERRSAEAEFLAHLTDREEEFRRAYEADRKDLERREDKDVYRNEYMARLDAYNDQEKKRIKIEEERLRGEEQERRRKREDRDRQRDDERLDGLWSADDNFFRMLSLVDVVVAAVITLRRKGFSLVPRVIFDAVWAVVSAECGADDGARTGASGSFYSQNVVPDTCPAVDGVVTDAMVCAGEPDSTQVFGVGVSGYAGSTLWWAWSAAGSTAETFVRGSCSSVGWVLRQTLGRLIPSMGCEAYAVLLLGAWLLSLVVVVKAVGWAGADSHGPTANAIRLTVVVAWVWGRFHSWVLATSRELLLSVVPAPLLLVVYGMGLKYVERHIKPGGFWWVRRWDVRPFVSRILPAVVSLILALVLGSLSV